MDCLCERYRSAGWHRGNWHHLLAVFGGFGPAYPKLKNMLGESLLTAGNNSGFFTAGSLVC